MKKPVFYSTLRIGIWTATALAVVAILFFWREAAISQNADDPPTFLHETMTIKRTDGTSFPFSIEVAATKEQAAYGLMFRHSLPQDSGMIFLWDPDQLAIMWMKNTFIPLDMLFVKHDGTISKIIANAQPLDLTPLSSDRPVRAVIEINAGEAARRGLKAGDKVIYAAFGTTVNTP